MNRYEKMMARISNGETIMIDGGTGTEIEKLGATMVKDGWNSMGVMTHPEIVKKVHEDYIRAGGEMIISNTFSTSRYVLRDAGLEEHFEFLNRRGVEIALEARDAVGRPDVLVAASLSYVRFVDYAPSVEEILADLEEQAVILAAAGPDLILIEMMVDIDRTRAILQVARKTGLPVWVGFSARPRAEDGVMCLFRGDLLADGVKMLLEEGVPMMFMMHSLVEHIDAGLDVVREYWDGPVGVYAHSGRFQPPNWVFEGVISEQDYGDLAMGWVERGVQMIGGCCGIGVNHMTHLCHRLKRPSNDKLAG